MSPKPESHPPFSLRLLHLEDNAADAELIEHALAREWSDLKVTRVESGDEFVDALRHEQFDLILSDFSLPRFNGLDALRVAREACPDTPFVFLSGTIGEENAVEALKQGATDYVIKDRMARLVPAIRRAISAHRERRRRQEVESALHESQERFQQLAEQSSDIFWFVALDPERILYVSPAVEKIWSRPAEEFYTNPREWMENIHPNDVERVRAAFDDCISGKKPGFEEEYRVVRPDGGVRWVLDSATIIRDANGRPVRLSGIAKDISKRKADEERLREQAGLLDKARDAIVVTDLDRRVVFWNGGAERVFGWPASEALGRRAPELFGEDTGKQFDQVVAKSNADEWQGEITVTTRAGEKRILNYSVTLIRDNEGRPRARMFINTDITEKKKLEEQFLRAQRLEGLGMLAAGIAHDLNNILAPVLMGAPLLRPRAQHPSDVRVLETIERSAERGAALVRQILSFAQGASGGKSLVQVRHLLRDISNLIKETFPKVIQFSEDLPAALWPIEGNPTQIHQVVLNLCVNARDAMPNGGSLRLRASNRTLDEAEASVIPDAIPGPYLVIEVSDTGTGIPPEILDKIWDPFYTTKGEGRGTGLGLATVRGIAANHGGFATVRSTVGRGTTFEVYLPAAKEANALRESPGSAHPFKMRGAGELVLVVDDESTVGDMIKVILTRNGYRVLTAANGLEAITLFTPRSSEFSLVLTDINMPEMGGLGLAHALPRLSQTVRISFMTGAAIPPELVSRERSILRKPFSSEQLLTFVREAIDAPARR